MIPIPSPARRLNDYAIEAVSNRAIKGSLPTCEFPSALLSLDRR